MYFIINEAPTPTRAKMSSLVARLDKFTAKIKEEMKTIYILRTNKDNIIACADESLVKKCIDRLGKENVKYSKMQVCQTEEDLEGVLLEDKLEEQMKTHE